MDLLPLKVVLDIAISCFVCHCRDGTGLIGLSVAENDFRIFVGLTLVFTGEVQVDIRLLVTLEAQEGLEGDVKAVLLEFSAASGAHFTGHVDAAFALIGKDLGAVKV